MALPPRVAFTVRIHPDLAARVDALVRAMRGPLHQVAGRSAYVGRALRLALDLDEPQYLPREDP